MSLMSNLKMAGDCSKFDEENYYDVLEVDRNASEENMKRSYQRLVRLLHPDKQSGEAEYFDTCCNQRFLDVQQAWSVLKDPEQRKRYDAFLSCREHSSLLLYDTLDLSALDYDETRRAYLYLCRCGGYYTLKEDDLNQSQIIVGCDECSFSILVNTVRSKVNSKE